MLWYCPLECYAERYTMQLSAPKIGWLERNWIAAGIPYGRIEGNRPHTPASIGTGVALDAVGRSKFAMHQVSTILTLLEQGTMKSGDVIYFDDFWHPGMEAIAYTCHLKHVSVKMYANLWAQSVDEYDFTHGMKKWIRHYEKGNGAVLSGIFVACPTLKSLVVESRIAPKGRVHAVGHPFCSDELRERMTFDIPREQKVVYSSRWDVEKRPLDFLAIARLVKEIKPDVQFVVCTGSRALRSNDVSLLAYARNAEMQGLITIKENLTKLEYYRELTTAKVQVNTSLQDWISYVLLEASVAGCYPVYPCFRSFPETLRWDPRYLYDNIEDAAALICHAMDEPGLFEPEGIERRRWIHSRFDSSWRRMAIIMGLLQGDVDDPFQTETEETEPEDQDQGYREGAT